MKGKTSEFSFIVKPAQYGVGVFTAHDIKAGTYLRLFGDESEAPKVAVARHHEEIPPEFDKFCPYQGDETEMSLCPRDFGQMGIGWYMNHSFTPNVRYENFRCYALCDIKAGEEVTLDYNSYGEPEEYKESFYKK